MVINSNLGAFAITSCNLAISSWTNLPLSVAGIIVESLMIAFATYKGDDSFKEVTVSSEFDVTGESNNLLNVCKNVLVNG